ncbi:Helix-loop-helix DNA-binding domain protein [Metarhizium rileyi]|uniref:Helix-loop-helix DNA-binding domain protein n=1 Tax=Metarhizium rileyi (strain RCEF 4871) TaxID=1649241 RepID=A0A167KFZ4_METRR|nr:Helix-loop-helix DNA-binding domain protein [Metarhizium rileyi RCEF 4871]
MEQDPSSSRPASQAAQDTSSWETSAASAAMDTFDFTSAPPEVSIPSFDPAIAAFADMSFTRPPARSPYPPAKNTMAAAQSDALQERDFHDRKRMKVESDTPALDSIDYWISFDDDLDKMGSFEIDYSKRPLSQNSGLYSTSTAPFREEDFFDDSAFEQVLSDDEEMFESTDKSGEKVRRLESTSRSQQPADDDAVLSGSQLESTLKDGSQQMRRTFPQGPEPDVDEHRRFLEEALNSGRIPGALIPPNGFGIGFGAGMGCRPPQEFVNRPLSSSEKPVESQDMAIDDGKTRTSDIIDEAEPKKQTNKRPTTTRGGSSKRAAIGAPKPRSADRIAHNDVERKYRTNLKDKIAELRAAVPSLQASGGDGDSEGGSAGGQQSGAKISKVSLIRIPDSKGTGTSIPSVSG